MYVAEPNRGMAKLLPVATGTKNLSLSKSDPSVSNNTHLYDTVIYFSVFDFI